MCASCNDLLGTRNDNRDEKTGLSGNHGYSLIDAFEIEEKGGKRRLVKHGEKGSKNNERIVKLRNPWGSGEWKGEWSDEDKKKWTNSMMEFLKHEKKDDGLFYMPFKEFYKYFGSYEICFYDKKYQTSSQKFQTSSVEPTVIEFEVTQPGEYYISMHQKNERFFRKSDKYEYSYVTMLVAKTEGSHYKYKGMVKSYRKQEWFKENFSVGKYIILLRTPWRRKVNQLSISAYGPGKVNFITKGSNPPKNFVNSALLDLAERDEEGFKWMFGKTIKTKKISKDDGFGYYYIDNTLGKQIVKEIITLPDEECYEILPPYNIRGNRIKMIVKPGEKKLAAYRMVSFVSKLCIQINTQILNYNERNIQDAERRGNKAIRKYKDQDVGIYVYTVTFGNAVLFIFKNDSKDCILKEVLKFNLKNCKISELGKNGGNQLKLIVGPGEEDCISIFQNQEVYNSDWEAKIEKSKYFIYKINESCNFDSTFF